MGLLSSCFTQGLNFRYSNFSSIPLLFFLFIFLFKSEAFIHYLMFQHFLGLIAIRDSHFGCFFSLKFNLSKVHYCFWLMVGAVINDYSPNYPLYWVLYTCIVLWLFVRLYFRNRVEEKREIKLREDDILRLAKLILPALNLVISKTRVLFSGDPSMTLKVIIHTVLNFILIRSIMIANNCLNNQLLFYFSGCRYFLSFY